MFELVLVKNDGTKTFNITPLKGSITWDSNLSLMSVLEFELIYSDVPNLFPRNPCDLGDVVLLLKDEQEIYRGVIVTEGRSGRDAIKYTVYDYAWYLGKSKSVYQFNNIPASQAITRILNDFGMLIGHVPTMNTLIDEIFLEKSPAEIIENIYKLHEARSGLRLNAEMRKGKIYFEDIKNLVIIGTFRLADTVPPNDVMSNPLGAEKTRTIESMRNRVKILIERNEQQKDQAKYEVIATAQNDDLIGKYGLLEDVFKIDAEDEAKAREVARILLDRLGRIQETNGIKLMGDVSFKAGRLLDVTEPVTGIAGQFMILSVKHTLTNQVHTMDLELVRQEDVK